MPGPNTKLEYLRDFCKSRGYCDNCPVKDPNDECWVELEGKLTTYYERAFDENARIRKTEGFRTTAFSLPYPPKEG